MKCHKPAKAAYRFGLWLTSPDRSQAELKEVWEFIEEQLTLLEQEDFFGTEGLPHALELD